MTMPETTLPELTDARLDELESALFARIADERQLADAAADAERARVRAVRRGRVWMGAAAAASIVAVAAVIAPQLAANLNPSSLNPLSQGGSSIALAPATGTNREGELPGVAVSGGTSASTDGLTTLEDSAVSPDATRDVIATASASLTVGDARDAANAIAAAASDAGGYVESLSVGGTVVPVDAMVTDELSYPAAVPAQGAWITVRVPADRLTDVLADLGAIGEVTSSQVDRRDVTTEAVDLRARVTALQASVDRLTQLMASATSTADLLTAETALSERQAELDGLRQQLAALDGQVEMSTLSVSLSEPAPVAQADPAGFGDGISTGWSSLVATLNGVVVALGFLLPWIAVIAVAGVVVWAIRRAVIRRRGRAGDTGSVDAD